MADETRYQIPAIRAVVSRNETPETRSLVQGTWIRTDGRVVADTGQSEQDRSWCWEVTVYRMGKEAILVD